MGNTKDIQERVLWVIQSTENQKSGGGTDLRVIQWIVDGKPGRPMLEKRDWFLNPDGDRKAGKAKGFSGGDLYLVVKHVKAIANLMQVKPEHLDEALQLAMFQDDKPTRASATGKSNASTTTPGSKTTGGPEDAFRQAPAAAASGAPPDVEF